MRRENWAGQLWAHADLMTGVQHRRLRAVMRKSAGHIVELEAQVDHLSRLLAEKGTNAASGAAPRESKSGI